MVYGNDYELFEVEGIQNSGKLKNNIINSPTQGILGDGCVDLLIIGKKWEVNKFKDFGAGGKVCFLGGFG